jgi:hypothetical protein
MTTRREWRGNLSAMRAEKRQAVDQYLAQRFPIHHEIQKLEDELNAFNERIEELENEGHRSHAMEVLKANALDFARQIDELRCLLVESASKDALSKKIRSPMNKGFAKRPCCDTSPALKNGASRYGEGEKTSSSRVVKRRRSHTEDDGER